MNRGMLAIWSDVEPAMVADYLHWLTREHTAERVGTEGFEGVRVFRANPSDINRYLILYDLAGPEVLTSPAYLARLNDPTPWSRRIMPVLRNFARGGGEVSFEAGLGRGGHLAAYRLDQSAPADSTPLRAIMAEDRVCAVRLLTVNADGTEVETNEKTLRSGDTRFPGLLLVEALDADALHAALASHRAAIAQAGVKVTESSTYSLIFALGKADLRRQSSVA